MNQLLTMAKYTSHLFLINIRQNSGKPLKKTVYFSPEEFCH